MHDFYALAAKLTADSVAGHLPSVDVLSVLRPATASTMAAGAESTPLLAEESTSSLLRVRRRRLSAAIACVMNDDDQSISATMVMNNMARRHDGDHGDAMIAVIIVRAVAVIVDSVRASLSSL